jgi:hypothetical protein
MLLKLTPISSPFRSFQINLKGQVKVYDKVLLSEELKEVDQLRNKDWIYFMGRKYEVEVVDELSQVCEPDPQKLRVPYSDAGAHAQL